MVFVSLHGSHVCHTLYSIGYPVGTTRSNMHICLCVMYFKTNRRQQKKGNDETRKSETSVETTTVYSVPAQWVADCTQEIEWDDSKGDTKAIYQAVKKPSGSARKSVCTAPSVRQIRNKRQATENRTTGRAILAHNWRKFWTINSQRQYWKRCDLTLRTCQNAKTSDRSNLTREKLKNSTRQ